MKTSPFLFSIITPVFHGERYICGLIDMAIANYETINSVTKAEVQLVLVNDDPSQLLSTQNNNYPISIRIINNKKNLGIHEARKVGLQAASGDYILFLDQDDLIKGSFLKEQIEYLDTADIVVCNGKKDGLPIYKTESDYEKVLSKAYYRSGFNPIVSPGQVLMKKNLIPSIWQKASINNSGADDFLLWILMLEKDVKFAINKNELYQHRDSGENASNNRMEMRHSVHEVFDILLRNNIWSEQLTQAALNNYLSFFLSIEEKNKNGLFEKYTALLDKWLELRDMGKEPAAYFEMMGVKKVIIYGMGMLGKHLYRELKGSSIEVTGYFDKDISISYFDMKRYSLEDDIKDAEMIVVTPFAEYNSIKEQLEKHYIIPIVSICSVINNMGVDNYIKI